MGYIPPVRDAQSLVYGNRHQMESQLIDATPATEKIIFPSVLSHYSSDQQIWNSGKDLKVLSLEEKRKESIIKGIEQQMTGKGTTIDVSI